MTAVFWTAFEVLINYYQGCAEAYFACRLMSHKKLKRFSLRVLIFGLFQGTVITLNNFFTSIETLGSVFYLVVLFVFLLIEFKGRGKIKMLFSSVIPLLMLMTATTLTMNFSAVIFGTTVEDLVKNQDMRRFAVLMIIQLVFFITAVLLPNAISVEEDDFAPLDWLPILSIIILSFAMYIILHIISLDAGPQQRYHISIAYMIVLAINILVLIDIHSLLKKNNRLKELELVRLHEQYQRQYVDNANVQYDSIRKMRHDMKNKMSVVYNLLEMGEYDKAKCFIRDNQQLISPKETVVHTNSPIVNAIVNSKLSSALAFGIKASCMSVTDFNGISDIDLCNLLSNVLDNALDACINDNNSVEKYIMVEISREENVYSFFVKNTIDKSVLLENPKLLSTKKMKENHGLGTKILDDISKKYSGRCDYYEGDETFTCHILLRGKDLKH